MATSQRRGRRGDFLEKYNAVDSFLLRPNRARGVAGLVEGIGQDGQTVLIRTWSGGAQDEDLREIWRNELRVLHRLGGAPGAEDFIARLVDAGEDKQGFHIALSVGDRRPLAVLLASQRSGSIEWLRRPTAPANRRRLWRNLHRIVQGLEILHEQGLLHCNIDVWSVLTTGGDEPDFQLTGFEWSMRLVAVPERHSGTRKAQPSERPISFLNDWADFARLCAVLLNVAEKKLTDLLVPAHEVSDHLTAEEASLLRDLLFPNELTQLDGGYVRRRIDSITGELASVAALDNAKHHLILNLGAESALSRAIREASDLSVEIQDIEGQRQFVRNDLSAEPRILAVKTAEDFRLVLRGSQLFYHLRQYAVVKNASPSWEFVACDKANLVDDWGGQIVGAQPLAPAVLDIMTMGEARDRAPRLRGRTLNWELVRAFLERAAPKKLSRETRTYQALVLLHAVELAMASADVFPVRVVGDNTSQTSGEPTLNLALEHDPDREALSKTLGLRSLAERLNELTERESISDEEGWLLSDTKALGRRTSTDIALQFETAKLEAGERLFSFRMTAQQLAPPASGLLVPGEFQGRLAQFRRRARALRALGGHAELLRMMADARGRLIATHETLADGEGLERLDEAKQKALAEIVAILPLYLVQGPPGVGKTFLVRDLVRRRMSDEPASRLLLTAQSHHAVDHLAAEIQKDWDVNAPLAVRCRSVEDREAPGPLDVRVQTQSLIERLSKSAMANAASPRLLQTLEAFRSADSVRRPKEGGHDRRSLDGLIMRAANVVFATTNSGDLERLLEERAPFDWAIIEEAAKATGAELLMPLLLSHRRLMIGDHKQLPPFESEKLQKLLRDPGTLRDSLSLGLELIERPLKEGISEELLDLLDEEETEGEFAALCAEAQRVLFLFESIIETEAKRQAKPNARGEPIARVLDIQHRMHPKIAGLVSVCFYDGAIKTASSAAKKFTEEAAPVKSQLASSLPNLPIVVVNMPYQQSTMGKRQVERYPRFTNPGEAEAVRDVIKSIVANPDRKSLETQPSLAVLSPYTKQVDLLKIQLSDDGDCQSTLREFKPVARGNQWCSTVDAFQGNEADVVIISFVRNNHHATLGKALGFLSDPRRMNVLLSRARWRLYVVASLEFLETVTNPLGLEDLPEAAFLRRFLATIEAYSKEGSAAIIDWAKLRRGQQ